MKNISLILNIILLIAVAILFGLHFSGGGEMATTEEASSPVAVAVDTASGGGVTIAYVNADTLFEKYTTIKNYNKKSLAKQTAAENEYRNAMAKFQEEYVQLQQQAAQGMISETKFNMEQQALQKKQEDIVKMEERIAKMLEDSQAELQKLTANVYASFREYNKDQRYDYILSYSENGGQILSGNTAYDITDEVINYLNEQAESKTK